MVKPCFGGFQMPRAMQLTGNGKDVGLQEGGCEEQKISC